MKSCLAPHLRHHGVEATAIVVTTSRDQRTGAKYTGGGRWSSWHRDLRRLLPARRDPDRRVSTLFDLYGLPPDFPGLADVVSAPDSVARAERAETQIAAAVEHDERFLPYVQRHEFEALVLAALDSLSSFLDTDDQRAGMTSLQEEIAGIAPEDVNDGPDTAPSKRLLRALPGYQKTLHGLLAVEDHGLARIRETCPRFSEWVRRLEEFGWTSGDS